MSVQKYADAMPLGPDDYDDSDDDTFDDLYDDEDDLADCALDPGSGQCGHAGSEHCDFECPLRNSDDFAGSRAFCKKHKQLYYDEVEVARHALGLGRESKFTTRNYFVTGEGSDDYPKWESIVSKGLAIKRDRRELMGGDWLYHLTKEGAEQALYDGEHLSGEDFPVAQATATPQDSTAQAPSQPPQEQGL